MAVQPVSFYRGSLPGALTTLYTYRTVKGADTVGFIEVVNCSDSEATVFVHVVPNGSTASASNAKMYGFIVAPRDSRHVTGWWPMTTDGDTVQGYGVGGTLACEVSGIRRT